MAQDRRHLTVVDRAPVDHTGEECARCTALQAEIDRLTVALVDVGAAATRAIAARPDAG